MTLVVQSEPAPAASGKPPVRGALVLGAADEAGLANALRTELAEARQGRHLDPTPPSTEALRAPERIAIDERIFVSARAILDQAGYVEPVELPVLEPGQKLFELSGPVIVLAPPLIGRRHVPLGHPVDPEFA